MNRGNLADQNDNMVGSQAVRSQTPSKQRKLVQTKSIECQVSPGLLAGNDNKDEDSGGGQEKGHQNGEEDGSDGDKA